MCTVFFLQLLCNLAQADMRLTTAAKHNSIFGGRHLFQLIHSHIAGELTDNLYAEFLQNTRNLFCVMPPWATVIT